MQCLMCRFMKKEKLSKYFFLLLLRRKKFHLAHWTCKRKEKKKRNLECLAF